MTDSTDNARGPERIWVDDERPIGGSVNVYNEPSEGALKYCVPYVRADLAPDPLRAVKVKPLVWEEPEFLGANPSYAQHTSNTPMGLYFANEHEFWYEGGPANSADNLEAAKAAAQADYEARIRSALEPDPQDARVKALVEAATLALGQIKGYGGDGLASGLDAALAAFDKGGKDE